MILTLPFPPSTNTYYRKFRNRMVIGAKGRAYKKAVALVCKQLSLLERERLPISGRGGWVVLHAWLTPPDKRKRDIDNFCGKALLDALKGIAFGDDSKVFKLVGQWSGIGDDNKPATIHGGSLALEVFPLL